MENSYSSPLSYTNRRSVARSATLPRNAEFGLYTYVLPQHTNWLPRVHGLRTTYNETYVLIFVDLEPRMHGPRSINNETDDLIFVALESRVSGPPPIDHTHQPTFKQQKGGPDPTFKFSLKFI